MAKIPNNDDGSVRGLIDDINKQLGEVAYTLEGGAAPTDVLSLIHI